MAKENYPDIDGEGLITNQNQGKYNIWLFAETLFI
jgi:hypothetical protein